MATSPYFRRQIYTLSALAAQLLKRRWLHPTTSKGICVLLPLNYSKEGGYISLLPTANLHFIRSTTWKEVATSSYVQVEIYTSSAHLLKKRWLHPTISRDKYILFPLNYLKQGGFVELRLRTKYRLFFKKSQLLRHDEHICLSPGKFRCLGKQYTHPAQA